MKANQLSAFVFAAVLVLTGVSCNKDAVTYFPPEQASFVGQSGGSYTIATATTKYTIAIGVTTTSAAQRTIPITVTSPTGAVQGTHYTLSATSVVIPAGSATGSIEVSGVFAQYTAGRKDTLVFSIAPGGAVNPSDFNSTFRLFVQGPCFDGDVTTAGRAALLGAYTKCFDGPTPYGPYSMTVKSITTLTPTTARAVIANVWDAGFGDVNFIMDWSNPASTNINVEGAQVTLSDGGNLGAAYAGMRIIIRASAAGGTGKFSVCKGTINLVYQLGIFNPTTNTVVGYFPDIITTAMAK
jgi:hypothetical protein